MNDVQKQLTVEEYCDRCYYLELVGFPIEVEGKWCTHPTLLTERNLLKEGGTVCSGVTPTSALTWCQIKYFKEKKNVSLK